MPGLQGVWLEDYSPAWKGSYTTDLNVEMNYWPVYASNHLDIAEPFYRCYKDLIPKFQKDTREYFGMQGIRIPICHDNRGNDGAGYLGGLYWQGASAWIASHFWKNYLFSHDESFLRDCAYPFMVECVRYYNSVLRKSGGRYIVYKSWTPEEMESDQIKAVDDNPAIDLSLIRGLYGAFVQTVDILGVQPEMDMELVRDIHGNLADYSREAGHIADSENCDFDYCHRHLSVATPIYPSGELNAYSSSEEDYRLGLSTFYKHIGRANGERRVYFSGTYTWLACVAATLGLKDFANVYLSDYLDSFVNQKNLLNMTFDFGRTGRGVNVDDTQTFSAGTEYEFAERVIQLESNTCAAEAVNLMLLQSFGDGISILPAYPWREAVFEGLRAQGGFLVSARLREWRLESVFVESLEGRICTLYLDSDVRRVEVQDIADGETRSIPELAANDIGNRMRFSFDTEPGCEYEITVAY